MTTEDAPVMRTRLRSAAIAIKVPALVRGRLRETHRTVELVSGTLFSGLVDFLNPTAPILRAPVLSEPSLAFATALGVGGLVPLPPASSAVRHVARQVAAEASPMRAAPGSTGRQSSRSESRRWRSSYQPTAIDAGPLPTEHLTL